MDHFYIQNTRFDFKTAFCFKTNLFSKHFSLFNTFFKTLNIKNDWFYSHQIISFLLSSSSKNSLLFFHRSWTNPCYFLSKHFTIWLTFQTLSIPFYSKLFQNIFITLWKLLIYFKTVFLLQTLTFHFFLKTTFSFHFFFSQIILWRV